MKLKLKNGFGAVRNIVLVLNAATGDVVGEAHINRRPGWRGGPWYSFHPNEAGASAGLQHRSEPSVRALLA